MADSFFVKLSTAAKEDLCKYRVHNGPITIWLLAGETSGDIIASRLMARLRNLSPSIRFRGVGGPLMEMQGLKSLFPMQDLSVMGLIEILPKLRHLSQRLHMAVQDITTFMPNIVVTVDSPGFSLRLLKRIRKLSIPTVHYVAPQVWAWNRRRIKTFPGLWDKLLCLFPFEETFFNQHNLHAVFTGHPVIECGANHGDAEKFRQQYALKRNQRILILMPGSRQGEVAKLMPIYHDTLALLKKKNPNIAVVIAITKQTKATVSTMCRDWPINPILVIDGTQDKYNALAAGDIALTKSGTSTLELALAKLPMIITYRVNPITAFFVRRLLYVKYVGMINLLLNYEIAPELLQQDCNPETLAKELNSLLVNPTLKNKLATEYSKAEALLSPPNSIPPSEFAAREVLSLIKRPF